MFHSIRSKMVLSVVIMAALLGGLFYFSTVRLGELEDTLDDLQALEEYKSHVLIPQKDMNQFLAAMDNTVLLLELGEQERAQEAFDGSADPEMDISEEFAFLEANSDGDLLAASQQTHEDWEKATELLKVYAEKVAADRGIALVRPSTEPTKAVDAHTASAIQAANSDWGAMTVSDIDALREDRATDPVEVADDGIDTLEDSTNEVLAAEKEAGEKSVASASQAIMWGSLGVLIAIVAVGGVLTVSISRPMTELKNGAERVADGELGYQFRNTGKDEVGAVIHSVQKMSASLQDRIRNLEEVAGVVLLTGDEIQSAAQGIEPRTTEVERILDKSETLKDLVGQMLMSTRS